MVENEVLSPLSWKGTFFKQRNIGGSGRGVPRFLLYLLYKYKSTNTVSKSSGGSGAIPLHIITSSLVHGAGI